MVTKPETWRLFQRRHNPRGCRSGEDASTAHRELEEKLTKLLGEDNLVGSSGEFGLLFALLANKPGAKQFDGEPTVPLRDLEAMFLEKRLPDGWETCKKTRMDWVINTTGLLVSAGKKYWALKQHLRFILPEHEARG
jgi:hypothetical protein